MDGLEVLCRFHLGLILLANSVGLQFRPVTEAPVLDGSRYLAAGGSRQPPGPNSPTVAGFGLGACSGSWVERTVSGSVGVTEVLWVGRDMCGA